jgi:hypothetical protein
LAFTYCDTTWDSFGGQLKGELELERSGLKPTLPTQGNFILEEGSEAIPKISGSPLADTAAYKPYIPRYTLADRPGAIVDLDETMEADDEVTDPEWLRHRQDHRPFHLVTGRVLSMWVLCSNVKFCQLAFPRCKRECKLG